GPQAARLKAGDEQIVWVPVNRNGSEETVSLRAEALPQGVSQVAGSPGGNPNTLALYLKIDENAAPRVERATLSLWARDCRIDAQALSLTIESTQAAARSVQAGTDTTSRTELKGEADSVTLTTSDRAILRGVF